MIDDKENDDFSVKSIEIPAPVLANAEDIDALSSAFIVMATPMQLHKLIEHGWKTIGVDTTHQVSKYNHNLTTIIVQDERNEGFPVAFCISKHKNAETYEKFFAIVKSRIGGVSCKYFISDGDMTLYNCWKRVMGPAKQARLCIWHVKRSWGRKLQNLQIKKGSLLRARMEKQLEALLEEKNRKR